VAEHPRAAAAIVVGLLVVMLLIPWLMALSQHTRTGALAIGQYLQTPTATTAPTATATAAPPPGPGLGWASNWQDTAESAYVDDMISHMSLNDEIGQMMMISTATTVMDTGTAGLISQYHPGSVILYALNIAGKDQVTKLIHDMQAQSPIPMLVATDQEGGGVNRMLSIIGPVPSAADVAATGDPNAARQRGIQDAQVLANAGINLNLAPVVDVLNNSGADGGRAFGTTPQVVTTFAGAYLEGLQQGHKVAGTLKHFPGLGDVPTNPDNQVSYLTRDLNDLERIDWAPYKALIATGQVDAVMSTAVIVTAVDRTVPATLSYPVLTGILRNKLGFNGVIVTDAVFAKGLYESGYYPSFAPIYVKAIQAGNDIICSVGNFGDAQLFVQAIHDAIANGTLTKARIDESVRRILLLKLRYGVLALNGSNGSNG
jgi:beta-N-acetylhexosaminidase